MKKKSNTKYPVLHGTYTNKTCFFNLNLNFTRYPVLYLTTLLLTLEIFQFPFFNLLSTFKKCIEIPPKVLFRLPLFFVGLCFFFILHYPLSEILGKDKSKKKVNMSVNC